LSLVSAVSPVVQAALAAAVDVLRHNASGPFDGLPRTAGWGYPEPYTRDLMIALPGFLLTGDDACHHKMRETLECLAAHQSPRGHVPSLAHDPSSGGASDTTPLFLLGLSIYREHVGDPSFLDAAARRSLIWMRYQSVDDGVSVTQLPTSDWRDEHWVLGHGLYVNAISYAYLRRYGKRTRANALHALMNDDALTLACGPHYPLSHYKIYRDERFDLLGNSLAILTGIASPERSRRIIAWVEEQCLTLREHGDLCVDLPPCLFPFMRPGDADWRERYAQLNPPGEYHNGGVWPFVCGFYIAACVAAGELELARARLEALAKLVKPWHENEADWGFNEQIKAQTGQPIGRDWQTWSAAMFLYAARCVELHSTPWFDAVRLRDAHAGPRV
jgi:hypothetical protein